jgi:autotransporter-associated beta strand protein
VTGAQLDFGGSSHNGVFGFGSLSGGGASGGNIVNAAYANSGIYVGFDNTSTKFGGRIVSGTVGGAAVNSGGLQKVGTGTLTLTGSGNDAGGTTQIRGGGLGLDFSQSTTGTDILASTRAVSFQGGQLLLTGSSGGSNSQTLNGITVARGDNGIALTSNGATGLLASLGAIARNSGGTLDITLPSGAQSATNGVRTTTTNVTNSVATASTTAYLTVGGTTWATVSSNNIVPLASYATGNANYTSTNNVDVSNGDTISTGTVNTLRFNGNNTLNLTGTTTIGAGGVLVTRAASTGASFSGGTFRPGGGNELVLINHGGKLTVGSVIANNGSTAAALTLAGPGSFRLNGNNTYTGTTTITSGTVLVGSATALGVSGSSAVWIADNPNAVLDLNGFNISIGSLAGAGGEVAQKNTYTTAGGLVSVGSNAITIGGDNTSTTYGGRFSGSGTITKVGTGNLSLSGATPLSGFSGVLAIESGTLTAGNTYGRTFGGDPFGSASLQLGKTGGGSSNASLNVASPTTRPVVLAAGNTGALTIQAGVAEATNGTLYFGGTVTGTGDVVLSSPLAFSFFSVTSAINNVGKVKVTSSVNQARMTVSGTIGSNVTDVTVENSWSTNNDPNAIYTTLSGGLNNTGTVSFTGVSNASGVAPVRVNGIISQASGLTLSGTYTVSLGAANTFTGNTLIQAGTLVLGNSLALQNSGLDTSGAGVLNATGIATPTFGGLIGSTSLSATNITGYGSITALTLNPQSGKSYTYSGNIGNGAANMTLTKSGSGTQILSGSNTYSGTTTVSAGMMQFARVNSLYGGTTANWTATNIRTGSGATLAFNVGGTDEFTTGNVTTLLTNLASSTSAANGMNAGSLLGFDTTNAAGGTFTISDAIGNTTGGSGGARGLRKLGTGSLVLSGSNTYTGATTVEQGSLLVNGQLSTSAVTVQSGGLLGGSGTLGNVNVLAGGTFSPGNSPGLISVAQLALAGTTLMEIDGLVRGSAYDAVDGSGLTYGGSMVIDFGSSITSAFADNTTFNLFAFGSYSGQFSGITTANDGSWYGGLTFVNSGDNNKWMAEKASQTLEFTHSTGALVIVPEPGAIALAGIGIAAAAYALRRRRRA